MRSFWSISGLLILLWLVSPSSHHPRKSGEAPLQKPVTSVSRAEPAVSQPSRPVGAALVPQDNLVTSSAQPAVRPKPEEIKLMPAPKAKGATARSGLSDNEIIQLLLARSVASYSGNCRCPEDTDRAGRRCGKRSAYLRAGGATPLCYETDVTAAMVEKYRKSTTALSR